jgi:gluconate 2-dehydrogenase gamma chain
LAAGAHNYIEAALTGPLAHRVADYRDGLDLLDAEALRRHGVGFADATDSVQDAVLRLVEQRPFFELLREHTIEGLLGDPVHGGNRGHIGWTLIGYRRPGLPITAAAQGSVEGRSL